MITLNLKNVELRKYPPPSTQRWYQRLIQSLFNAIPRTLRMSFANGCVNCRAVRCFGQGYQISPLSLFFLTIYPKLFLLILFIHHIYSGITQTRKQVADLKVRANKICTIK